MAGKTGDTKAVVFEPADLIKDARNVFGVNPEVMAGALYKVSEPLTIEDAKKKLDDFLSRPIQ
jgi:hypothetical protein